MANVIKSLDALFISKVRIKALKYFVFNQDTPIHLRGAVRKLGEEINAVRRELGRLDDIGFLTSEKRGNKKYFSLNTEHPLLDDLTSMMNKAFGLGGSLIKNANKLGEIKMAALTKAYLKNDHTRASKVDLVIVGKVEMDLLASLVEEAEKKMKREINYVVLSKSEFVLRQKRRDSFLMNFMMTEKLFLIGHIDNIS